MSVFIVEQSAGELLSRHRLDHFDALWSLPPDWVEPINVRKGGWSGVVKLVRDGVTFYVKRQHRQTRRLRSFPWRVRPTYFHEFQALKHLGEQGVPVVQWALYAERGDDAILVTRGADGFVDLNTLLKQGDAVLLRRAACRLSEALALMHRIGWQHGACYPAHLLVHPDSLEVRLLDLERSRRHWLSRYACKTDIDQLQRRACHLSAPILTLLTMAPPQAREQAHYTEIFS